MANERDCVIDDNDRGQITVEGNELLTDSKIADASKMRVGSPRGPSSGGGGAYTYDVVTPPDDPEEKVTRREICSMTCGEGVDGAEWGLTLLKKGGNTVDADQIKTMRVTAADIEFMVPVKFSAGGSVVEPPTPPTHVVPVPNELRHPEGVYWMVIQGDGNLVAYKNRVPFDYATGAAYWSSGTVDPTV